MLKLQIIGNLGQDAIVRETNSRRVISFSVAHTEKFKGTDGVETEKTTWVNCGLWRNADQSTGVASYLLKGQKVYVEGKPDVEQYVKDGKTYSYIRLQVSHIELLGSAAKPESQAAAAPSGASAAAPASNPGEPPADFFAPPANYPAF